MYEVNFEYPSLRFLLSHVSYPACFFYWPRVGPVGLLYLGIIVYSSLNLVKHTVSLWICKFGYLFIDITVLGTHLYHAVSFRLSFLSLLLFFSFAATEIGRAHV